MIGEEHLKGEFTGGHSRFAHGVNDHPFGCRGRARSLQAAGPLHRNNAHAAGADIG